MTLRRVFPCLVLLLTISTACAQAPADSVETVAEASLQGAEDLLDMPLTPDERALMREDLAESRNAYRDLRAHLPENAVAPALLFDPLAGLDRAELAASLDQGPPRWSDVGEVKLPKNRDQLAWFTVAELSALVKSRQISCVDLATFFIERLRRFDPQLHCVVTITEERALARARELDAMLDRGEWLGPLHGIPYGAKDLLAVAGYPTTWGAEPYRDQVIDGDATVVQRLDEAGAVLVAKLTLGALAWGDVWFGGTTRNPWNPEEGSSGSSAGSSAAVGAGLVPFALGTETWGSIVSPSTRCGVTGLRPTFGRVSRAGAMALSWSMDKIGPIARSVEDCALVFDAIRGGDPADATTIDMPFSYTPQLETGTLRVGYLESAFAESSPDSELCADALDDLHNLGVELVPVDFDLETLGVDPYSLAFILSAEAGAAFQELVLSGRDDLLVRQERNAWPNVFRAAQFIPAVEYIQANRHRTLLMEMMDDLFSRVDVYVTPSFGGANLLVTNLTGHPQVVAPAGFAAEDVPRSISFVGRLHDEATVLGLARLYEGVTTWHLQHPVGY